VVPFILGILISFYFIDAIPINITFIIGMFVGILIILFAIGKFKYKYRWLSGAISTLLFILLGILFQNLFTFSSRINRLPTGEKYTWIGKVIETTEKKDKAQQAIVNLYQFSKQDSSFQKKAKLLIYSKADSQLMVGDIVLGESFINSISKPLNPYQFDYAAFLNNRGIQYQTFIHNFSIIEANHGLLRLAKTCRQNLIQCFQNASIQGDELSVLIAITLGDKSQLDQEIKNAYAGAGAMHILAVSGLHVGIVFLIFNQLLSFLKGRWFGYLKAVLLLAIIWSFALLSGLSPSVQRAGVMFSFIIIGGALKRKPSILNSISAAAFILLIFNPMLLFEVGFQLSFAAVIGIVSLHPIIYNWWRPDSILIDKIWSLIVVSFCAQLATLPFTFYYFHQFPNWFLLTNLFVIPLAFAIVSGAIIVATLSFVFESDLFLGYVLNKVLWLLNHGILLMQELPYFVTSNIWINEFQAFLLALSIVLIIIYLHHYKSNFFIISIAALCLIFGISFVQKFSNHKKKVTALYALRNQQVFLYKQGGNALILSLSGAISKYDSLTILDHLNAIDVEEMYFEKLNDTHSIVQEIGENQIIQLGDKLILIGNSNLHNLSQDFLNKMDYILLNYQLPSEKIKQIINTNTSKIILGSAYPNWYKLSDEWSENEKNKPYLLSSEGYLEL
tara:strand:- start:7179 stop:9197 length:2019 start_codon:yes stop_codon:yes gene_type:complete